MKPAIKKEMDDYLSLFLNNQDNLVVALTESNEYTKKFGVILTKEDAQALSVARKESLRQEERIEFGSGILPKLIFTFCDSPYVYQDNYVDTLERLQDIFYLYKNESLDELTDDELLDFMKKEFDGVCEGSLDYLEDTCLEDFARQIRAGSHGFMGRYEEDEDEY